MNTFELQDAYLEHLFGRGHRKPPKKHKYVAKIETKNGVRYFYTQADLKAYYAGLRVKDSLGFDERDRRNAARSRYEQAQQSRRQAADSYREASKQEGRGAVSTLDYAREKVTESLLEEEAARANLEKSEEDYSKTLLGKFDNLIDLMKRHGKKKVSDIVVEGVKKLGDLYKRGSQAFKAVADAIRMREIKEYPVQKSVIKRNEQSIIEHLSGGDMTGGSCVSLAMAYAGNKAGYDVTDFRGGDSRELFADINTLKNIANMSDVEATVLDYNGLTSTGYSTAIELLNEVAISDNMKEFLFVAGGHMAVVRRNNMVLEYLEMQSGCDAYTNGWHELDDNILINRFGIHNGRGSSMLFDSESLQHSEEFLSLLSYINTPEAEQVKGEAGYVK